MTIQDATAKYGGLESDWREGPHGSLIHQSVTIGDEVRILGPCEFRGGVFWGGEFRGGVFWGGEFRGGVFRGGEFWDGVFRGGEFRGGVFWDGVFRGGVFWDGEFRGGEFWDGEFWGGEFRGGVFWDGVFRGTPLQLFGLLPWPINVSNPDRREIQVGCHHYRLEWWQDHWKKLPESEGIHEETVNMILQLAEKWFKDNPART